MSWKLLQTEVFEKRFQKLLPKNLRKQVRSQLLNLKENPYLGKPLGYRFFREKKVRKWRIYFIIYEEKRTIYLIDISTKKLQQTTIDKIKAKYFT